MLIKKKLDPLEEEYREYHKGKNYWIRGVLMALVLMIIGGLISFIYFIKTH